MTKAIEDVSDNAKPQQTDNNSDLSVSLWQSMRNEGTVGTTNNNRPGSFAITDNNRGANGSEKVLPAIDFFDSQSAENSPTGPYKFESVSSSYVGKSDAQEQMRIEMKFESVNSSYVGSSEDLYK